MSLWIPKQNNSEVKSLYHLFFDQYGHLYLESAETGKQSRIDFDRDNAPSSYLISNILTEVFEPQRYRMHQTNSRTLEYASQQQKEKDKVTDEDPEETEPDYYPDDLNYQIEKIPEGDDDLHGFFGTEMADLTDEHFAFSQVAGSKHQIPVRYNPDYETACLFETIIYDQTDLVLKSNLVQGAVMFRMTVNLAGIFSFRPTGSPEKQYYPLVDDKEEIIFIKAL